MNNCEAKTKNLRQFPASAWSWVSLLSRVTFYIGRVIAVIRGRGVALLGAAASHHHHNIHIADGCFCSRLCFPEHPLSVVTGLFCQGKSGFSSRACRFLFDWILLMNKQFATIGNCFCPLITRVLVVKSSPRTHNIRQWSGHAICCHPEYHQTGTFIENETESRAVAPYFTQCERWLTGAVQVKWPEKWHLWEDTRDPWDVMLFAQWI